MFVVESERLTAIAALEHFAYEITDKGLELLDIMENEGNGITVNVDRFRSVRS